MTAGFDGSADPAVTTVLPVDVPGVVPAVLVELVDPQAVRPRTRAVVAAGRTVEIVRRVVRMVVGRRRTSARFPPTAPSVARPADQASARLNRCANTSGCSPIGTS